MSHPREETGPNRVDNQHELAHQQEKETKQESYVVRYPKRYAITGIVCLCVICLFLLLPFLRGGSMALTDMNTGLVFFLAIFLALVLLCLLFILCTQRFKITVVGEHLQITPFFGAVKEFFVFDIAFIRKTNSGGVQGFKAYDSFDRIMFSANANATGYTLLFKQLQPLLRSDNTGVQTGSIVLECSRGKKLAECMYTLFILLLAARFFREEDQVFAVFMLIPFVIMLCRLLFDFTFRATLIDGLLTIKRPLRRTVTIPLSELRYGGDIRVGKRRNYYNGMILVDLSGKRVLSLQSNYLGFDAFVREFTRLNGPVEKYSSRHNRWK